MPFPTVKSNPYATKRRTTQNKTLWPGAFWKKLCDEANSPLFRHLEELIPDTCCEMIGDINLRMYGKR